MIHQAVKFLLPGKKSMYPGQQKKQANLSFRLQRQQVHYIFSNLELNYCAFAHMCLITIPIFGNQECLKRGTAHVHTHRQTDTRTRAPQSKEISYAADWQDAPKTQQESDTNSRMRKENE